MKGNGTRGKAIEKTKKPQGITPSRVPYKAPSSSHTSTSLSGQSSLGENEFGESIRVALRVRPMMAFETGRGDNSCVTVSNNQQCILTTKGQSKGYRFNVVLEETKSQADCFVLFSIPQLIDSALDGYAGTIFAYGQTGSGKTYTMAGVEERLGDKEYERDDTEGLIPRAIQYMWEAMGERPEQFYVKSSFMEIYNEQIRDLLNPAAGILHCRWNVKNGFFVEDLMVVDCTNPEDLYAVLHEGMRNRKTGSHDLNKDSSRSHSIMTVYLISEMKSEEGHIFKKYGKVTFVDLAGSERLKESKSAGDMIKETGNINKSLFTLGKVISSLSSKKQSISHIAYRDSKLTQLLMDSLGGTARALMIACISPSESYLEETMSTLNYATRTMNIKNKPVIQMDPKEQIIYDLRREIQLLRMENDFLKEKLVNAGIAIDIPRSTYRSMEMSGVNLPPISPKPPLVPMAREAPVYSSKLLSKAGGATPSGRPVPIPPGQQAVTDMHAKKLLSEYQIELQRVKEENAQLRYQKEVSEKDHQNVMFENNALNSKLENLENIFVGAAIPKNGGEESHGGSIAPRSYASSKLEVENSEMRKKILALEEEKIRLKRELYEGTRQGYVHEPEANPDSAMVFQLQEMNAQLSRRVDYLHKRERNLLQALSQVQKDPKKSPLI